MIAFGEHVEAYLNLVGEHVEAYLNLEESDKLSDDEVALGVADILYAQGHVSLTDIDLVIQQVAQEVAYYRTGAELNRKPAAVRLTGPQSEALRYLRASGATPNSDRWCYVAAMRSEAFRPNDLTQLTRRGLAHRRYGKLKAYAITRTGLDALAAEDEEAMGV